MNDAQRKELDQLAKRGKGILTADAVVKHARNPETALHEAFEWDDTEAARRFRLDQARQVIRFYVYYEPQVERQVRAYVSVPSDRAEGNGYRHSREVAANQDWSAQLLEEVAVKVRQMRDSYAYIRILDDLWPRLEAVVDEYVSRFREGPDNKRLKGA